MGRISFWERSCASPRSAFCSSVSVKSTIGFSLAGGARQLAETTPRSD
jgi:hypothetical protein